VLPFPCCRELHHRLQLRAGLLPNEPRPVFRASGTARVLIVGQTPGRKVHDTGIPWNGPSFPLPHPSPRSHNWLKINSWFDREVLPELRRRFEEAMSA